jgi:alpha-tubulin suppressor-like RCC1 family protein
LRLDGSLWLQGNNSFGQIGDGSTFYASTAINIGSGYTDVKCTGISGGESGFENVYALKSDGGLWVWGRNLGQSGNTSLDNFLVPTKIGTNYIKIQKLRSEEKFSVLRPQEMIAQKSDGTLWYWGGDIDKDNYYYNTLTAKLTPTKIGVDSYASFTSLEKSVFAMKSDSSLWAWGTNEFGQLGDGTKEYISIPKKIGDGFISVSQSKYHTIALKKDGTLWAWGSNDYGQLGDGTKQASLTPKLIGSGYSKIVARENHTLAIKTDGSLWGWGQNAAGELGDGTTISSLAPKKIELR